MKRPIVVGITALVVCGLGVSASAAAALPGQFDDSAVTVSYADLNIQNTAGARVLYSRLHRASKSVCSLESYRELGSLSRVSQAEQCYTETLDEAVAKIDSDALKKIHTS